MKSINDYILFFQNKQDNIEILINYFKDCNFYEFNKEQLIQIGWSQFDKDLLLMPFYYFHTIKDGMKLKTIGNEIIIKNGDNLDNDTRGGYLAYGLTENMLNEYKMKKRNININKLIN